MLARLGDGPSRIAKPCASSAQRSRAGDGDGAGASSGRLALLPPPLEPSSPGPWVFSTREPGLLVAGASEVQEVCELVATGSTASFEASTRASSEVNRCRSRARAVDTPRCLERRGARRGAQAGTTGWRPSEQRPATGNASAGDLDACCSRAARTRIVTIDDHHPKHPFRWRAGAARTRRISNFDDHGRHMALSARGCHVVISGRRPIGREFGGSTSVAEEAAADEQSSAGSSRRSRSGRTPASRPLLSNAA
ncbi:hypothetical protein FHX39_003831 [Friedmanniella antarctica]|uniref:Uncharacterized protein n=1 Tax=Microlunatus antarcticus TaxID=53388 RepID=A0A7W5P8R0_9ACTN|nr:hypothetical protein [Microlunatus antarcticus]